MHYTKVLLLYFLVATGSGKKHWEAEWEDWKREFGRKYSADEEPRRLEIWKQTRKEVNRHNRKFQQGLESYTMELNDFADKPPEERKLFLSWGENDFLEESNARSRIRRESQELPSQIDWRDKGYVTRVRNQGTYGTCYAFAAVAAMEAQLKNVTGKLLELSVQQIVECNQGCNGGLMTVAFDYVNRVGGIQSRKSYPTPAGECDFDEAGIVGRVKDYVILPKSESSLKAAVAKVGPVAVGINVYNTIFSLGSGIYKCPTSARILGKHAVLVVGYGGENGQEYWLIKNR